MTLHSGIGLKDVIKEKIRGWEKGGRGRNKVGNLALGFFSPRIGANNNQRSSFTNGLLDQVEFLFAGCSRLKPVPAAVDKLYHPPIDPNVTFFASSGCREEKT